MKSLSLGVLAVVAVLLPILLASGGTWSAWLLAVAVPAFPAALVGLALGDTGDRRRFVPFVLWLYMTAVALGVVALAGAPLRLVAGLPVATLVMILGLGLIPLVATSLAYAWTFRASTDRAAPTAMEVIQGPAESGEEGGG